MASKESKDKIRGRGEMCTIVATKAWAGTALEPIGFGLLLLGVGVGDGGLMAELSCEECTYSAGS